VKAITKTPGGFEVAASKGIFSAKYVVNAAGVDSDTVSAMIGGSHFSITPKSGEYFILDTTEGGLVNRVIFPCPSTLGKGVLVAPTVHGNIIVGPDSKDWPRGNYATTAAGLDYVRKNALRSVPGINLRASIRNFSGLRADAGMGDFIVGESSGVPGFFNIAGIKSPGLSSAPAIALEIVRLLREKPGLDFGVNPRFVDKRRITRFKELGEAERHRLIQQNSRYGTIVCRCETVTEGEIEDALNRPLPPGSIDALKRRLRPGMGRCQGGFCSPKVLELIAKRFGIKPEEVPKDRGGTYIVTGYTKGGRL
jgi:glycerol-3-phosphate dehydrogenase